VRLISPNVREFARFYPLPVHDILDFSLWFGALEHGAWNSFIFFSEQFIRSDDKAVIT